MSITDSRYRIIRSLNDSRCWIEDKETGGLTEPFALEDMYISRIGMYEDLRIVYRFTVAVRNVDKEGGE